MQCITMDIIDRTLDPMSHQITVRLNPELDQRIDRLAERLNLRRSDIVRMALSRFLAESEGSSATDRPYDRVQHLIGSIASGKADLGENHREYLLQRFKRDV